jgi:hypothetical protein
MNTNVDNKPFSSGKGVTSRERHRHDDELLVALILRSTKQTRVGGVVYSLKTGSSAIS